MIAAAAYFNAGQDCTAATRVLAAPGIHDDLVAAVRQTGLDVEPRVATDGPPLPPGVEPGFYENGTFSPARSRRSSARSPADRARRGARTAGGCAGAQVPSPKNPRSSSPTWAVATSAS